MVDRRDLLQKVGSVPPAEFNLQAAVSYGGL